MDHNSPVTQPSPGRWKRFWFIVHLIEIRMRFVFVLIITGFLIGYWDVVRNYYDKYTRPLASVTTKAISNTEYFCPMHTFIVRDGPGKCPICGMDLVKKAKGEKSEL